MVGLAAAQTPTPGTDTPPPTPVLASPTPAALTDIAASLESSRSRLKELEETLSIPTPPTDIESGLETLSHEVTRSLSTTRLQLAQNPSSLELRELESAWERRSAPLPGWQKSLKQRAGELDAARTALQELEETWQAAQRTELPPELQPEVDKLVERMESARDRVRLDRNRLLLVLDRLNFVQVEIETIQAAIAATRQEQVKQILSQDAPALWNLDLYGLRELGPARLLSLLKQQLSNLGAYCALHIQRLLLHLLGLGLLYLGLKRVGAWIRPQVAGDPDLEPTAQIFASPLSTSLLLTYVVSPWIYPQPPSMLSSLLGLAVLIPAVFVLRRLLDPYWHSTLGLFVALFLIDQFRDLLTSQPVLGRLILAGELTLLLVFLAARALITPRVTHPVLGRTHRIRLLPLALIAVAWAATILGFSRLGTLIGQGTLWSAYLAIFLLALVKVLDALIVVALRTPPLALLASVQAHTALYRDRLQGLLRLVARLLWVVESLGFLGLRQGVADWLLGVWKASLRLGSFSLSLGTVMTMILALLIPFQLSRWVRFQLEEDLYPRLGMTVGHAYTLSRLIHYALLSAGALMGLSIVGVDMTKVTIVAGALGVGIGFGLQNIVNNFVSGLILLFERPIQVGDQIEVGGLGGTLQRIGIRASVLRTADGSEVIVPNGELISTRVTNWTLSDRHRLLRVDVGVEYGSPLDQVREILCQVARDHPEVSPEPAPEVLLVALADSSLNFQLRAWTDSPRRWVGIHSDLLMRAYEALSAAGISIPYPHRTLHLVKDPESPPSD